MKQLKLRFAKTEESQQIVDWLNNSQHNEYNPETLKNPSLRILCSYNEQGPQQYNLFSKVYMMESSAIKPGLEPHVSAQSFRDFTKACLLMASGEGIREIYALDCGGGLDKLATGNHFQLLGKEINGKFEAYKVYRIMV